MTRELLERYFTGLPCSREEQEAIRLYLEAPDHLLDELLVDEWQKADGMADENRKAGTWNTIQANITGRESVYKNMKVLRHGLWRRWTTYAAAALLAGVLLMCGMLFYSTFRKTSPELPQVAWKTIRNNTDNVQLAHLPDGTRIWLNSNSALDYAENYGQQRREIRLTGEAFFDVAQDMARPFTIYTDSLQTVVLGTSFNIRAWRNMKEIQIALVEGKVQVGTYAGAKDILQPGDLLRYDREAGKIKITSGGIRQDMYQWTAGKIVMDNTPLPEALEELEQIYQVKIRFNAMSLEKIKLTGKFNRGDIDTVLQTLLFAADRSYTKGNNGVYFIR
jgi:ferric-dicitrate binding protein FerR (iron transport regulator)